MPQKSYAMSDEQREHNNFVDGHGSMSQSRGGSVIKCHQWLGLTAIRSACDINFGAGLGMVADGAVGNGHLRPRGAAIPGVNKLVVVTVIVSTVDARRNHYVAIRRQ